MGLAEKIVVAVPVRNEESVIPACLTALTAQSRAADRIVLLLNNCTDDTLAICRAAQARHGMIEIVERRLTGRRASAGEARRLGFARALEVAGDGVILTTDADAVPGPRWVADNLAEIRLGADLVCGMARILPDAAAAAHKLAFDDMREALLLRLQDGMVALVDPDAADPWPRHQQNSGASLAVRAAVLRRAGGAPAVAAGEDRALVAALRLHDARVRHAPHIVVPVSGRLEGRAAGGMAETLKRRAQMPDVMADERLEPTVDALRRAMARARLRAARRGGGDSAVLAADLLIGRRAAEAALLAPTFGIAWRDVQAQSPVLQRRRVGFSQLARETRQAFALLEDLYGFALPDGASGLETRRAG
jgi:GT2 family glycosyltransferase